MPRHIVVRAVVAILTAVLSPAGPSQAQSQNQTPTQPFPQRSILIIVPFAPGASADGIARTIANEMSPRLGVPVVVENKAGAGGTLGLIAVTKSAPDGHTLSIGAPGAMTIMPQFPGGVGFDPMRDVTPVAKLVDVPVVIVANTKSGPKSIADLIARAKAEPGGLSYGSTGTRSSQHLAVEVIAQSKGVKLVHVPYRGSAPAVTDAIGGQIPFVSVDLTSAAALIADGQLTALAVTAPRRVSIAPQIPTLVEQGVEFSSQPWLGLFAAAATPAPILAVLSGHVRDILSKPDVQRQLRTLSLEPAYTDETAFRAHLTAEFEQWKRVVKLIGDVN